MIYGRLRRVLKSTLHTLSGELPGRERAPPFAYRPHRAYCFGGVACGPPAVITHRAHYTGIISGDTRRVKNHVALVATAEHVRLHIY